jgi:hypothetical protein
MGSPIASMHRWAGDYPNNGEKQDDLALLTKKLSEKDATKERLYDEDGKVYWGAYCTNDQTGEVVKGDKESGDCYDDQPLKWQNDLRGRVEYRDNQESNSDTRARALTIQDGKAEAWGEFVKNLGDGVGNWYRFDAAAGHRERVVDEHGSRRFDRYDPARFDDGIHARIVADGMH